MLIYSWVTVAGKKNIDHQVIPESQRSQLSPAWPYEVIHGQRLLNGDTHVKRTFLPAGKSTF